MKVEIKKKDETIPFGKIKSGMVFEYCGDYFIKTIAELYLPEAKYFKAGGVDLSSGEFCSFSDKDRINFVHSTAIVEE